MVYIFNPSTVSLEEAEEAGWKQEPGLWSGASSGSSLLLTVQGAEGKFHKPTYLAVFFTHVSKVSQRELGKPNLRTHLTCGPDSLFLYLSYALLTHKGSLHCSL